MLFNSYIFIFIFLPVTLFGWYAINYCKRDRAANFFLIMMSLWFYGYFNVSYLPIICGSIVMNFLLAKVMCRIERERKTRRFILGGGVLVNVAVIFYFKYYDFFLENINIYFGRTYELKKIALPLGISFFTFQQISFLVDSYREEIKYCSFDEYALFVSFFPQLVAGPIVMYSEIVPQIKKREKRRVIPQNFAKGMYILALGLFKKVIIADTFGKAVAHGFGDVNALSSMETLIVSVSYTFQLYFDFSGYCDMATGIGYMFNIELPQNFNSPYKATSIMEFWERWHMSLTRFLKTYIYIPLGGNRKGKIRTCVNIMIVYIVSGIWHGANWTFIVWGIFHGIFSCLNRVFRKTWEKLSTVTRWTITFMTVNVLWVVFRAGDILTAKLFIKKMFSLSDFNINEELYKCFHLIEFMILEEYIPFIRYLSSQVTGLYLWAFIAGAFFVTLNFHNSREMEFKPTITYSLATVILMVWSVMSFSGISTFLYFDF